MEALEDSAVLSVSHYNSKKNKYEKIKSAFSICGWLHQSLSFDEASIVSFR